MYADIKLTDNFYLSEFITTRLYWIPNDPPDWAINNLRQTAQLVQVIRSKLGKPITITSGYRSIDLNDAVGGVPNGSHCRGNAADFICPSFGTPRDVCMAILKFGIPFGQLIYEGSWVHISTEEVKPVNRVITATFDGKGKVTYTPGIK